VRRILLVLRQYARLDFGLYLIIPWHTLYNLPIRCTRILLMASCGWIILDISMRVCFFTFRITPMMFWRGFQNIMYVCVFHLPSLLNVRPRCLWLSTHATRTLPNINIWIGIFFCVGNKIASVFGDYNQQAKAWPIR